ncbi:MAG: response regulator [Acidobacteria bacterium]|nr:response regulator [Acidobacteriota bacterium]
MGRPGLWRWGIPVTGVVLAVAASGVLLVVPPVRTVAVVAIPELPLGIPTDPGSIFTYYPTATLEVREEAAGAPGEPQRFLRCRLPAIQGWAGFGLVSGSSPAPGATLKIRWRGAGAAHSVQIDVQERGAGEGAAPGEVFSAVLPFQTGRWMTTPLRLADIPRNQNYQPDPGVSNGVLDVDRLGTVAFTFPPGSDLTMDIADLRFDWPSGRWTAFAALATALFFVLLAQVAQLRARGARAERTLRTSAADYQTLFNAVNEGIWALDPETRATLEVNEAGCVMLGLSRDEIVGSPLPGLLQAADPDAPDTLEQCLTAPAHDVECRLRRPDGRLIWAAVETTLTTIGAFPRLLVVMRDIHDRKEAERESLKLEQRLAQSEKLEALGQLAGGIAHDFNNVLTGITLAAEVAGLRQRTGSSMAAEVAQIKDLAKRGSALTQQMLTFSRHQPVNPVPLRLGALIEHALSMLRRLIGEDVTLTFEARTERDTIHADRGQIEQVLVNLVVNARDAMPDGGVVSISVRAVQAGEEPALALPPGEWAVLEVRDTGHGMDEATRERAFEPFFTTKATGKGTGLGLATVYGIARKHSATISVDSAPGSGTTFSMAFPFATGQVTESGAPEAASAAAPQGTELLLVVEDHEEVRRLLVASLDRLGYRTLSADCPQQAEALYRAHRDEVALLLSDVVMPGETGPQLYWRLAGENPGLKVIFMSGYADDRSGCAEAVRDGLPFIQKPFDPAVLGRLIRDTLDGARPA